MVEMYTRQFNEPPKKIVEHGKAHFGTFSSVSSRLDIKGMHAPYAGIPLPAFISNIRIKSRLSYSFSLGNYLGSVEFSDFKVFGLSEVVIWNAETGKRYAYHSIMPARRRFVPTKTSKAICACYQKERTSRIFWEGSHDFFKCQFALKGDKVRPSVKGKMISLKNDSFHTDSMFVNPAPTSSRVSATWLSTMRIKGFLQFLNEKDKNAKEPKAQDGIALVSMNRAYYKFHTEMIVVTGLGIIKNKNTNDSNKKIAFNISTANIDAADNDKYNNNALILDGDVTALPPVVITHPFGINENWIIQDTEGMVDLTFTPVTCNSRVLNMILIRTSQKKVYGTFEGVLLTKDGEKVNLKNFPGFIIKKLVRT